MRRGTPVPAEANLRARVRRDHGEIYAELEGSGLDWDATMGGRHIKLTVAGRMVGIVPIGSRQNPGGSRAMLNVLAQVKRGFRAVIA